MTWTVDWTEDAERDLARLWLGSRIRHVITSAARRIDEVLSHDPMRVGESRDGKKRIAFVPPLGVDFEVDDEQHRVLVLAVWEFRIGPLP